MVLLQTSDGKQIEVHRDIANKFAVVKDLLADVGETDRPIPLMEVTADILEKVVQWCEHHKNDDIPPEEDEIRPLPSDNISEWDREFCKVDTETLFRVILAANYLDIKPLLDLGCKTVANMIKGKTPQQIRDLFGLENDFTPEEEEQIRREMAWALDS